MNRLLACVSIQTNKMKTKAFFLRLAWASVIKRAFLILIAPLICLAIPCGVWFVCFFVLLLILRKFCGKGFLGCVKCFVSPDLDGVFVWWFWVREQQLLGLVDFIILSIYSMAVCWEGTTIKVSADPSWSCLVKSTKVQGKREKELVKLYGSIVCLLTTLSFWHLQ